MDKLSIKVTLTPVTAPTIFPYLAGILDSKQRAHALRHMAELGYTAFLARQAVQTNLVPAQAIAPAVATLVSAAPAPFALAESVARPNPSPAPAFDPAALSESDSPSPDGLPTAMAEHLGEAMARFFPN